VSCYLSIDADSPVLVNRWSTRTTERYSRASTWNMNTARPRRDPGPRLRLWRSRPHRRRPCRLRTWDPARRLLRLARDWRRCGIHPDGLHRSAREV